MFFLFGMEGGLELESGTDVLLLESGDTLVGQGVAGIQVIDENPVLGVPYYWLQPYFSFQLFANIHFGPDAAGAVTGPTGFDIIEGPNDFEIRTPL